jgi:hypothetical protein
LSAEIRVWLHPSDSELLPDGTVALVYAKIHCPAPLSDSAISGVVFIDAFVFKPVPGDPDIPTYEDFIPDIPYPLLFITGNSGSSVQTLENSSRGYSIDVAQYVRDSTRNASYL